MNHEYGQSRGRSAASAMPTHAAEPGRSTRSAAAYDAEPASPAVQMKSCGGGAAQEEQKTDGSQVQETAARGISGPAVDLPFREQIQRSFGRHDVGGIRAHVGGQAAQACKGMGARAFAMGNHVAFREAPDLHTAAHEAAHVVQQRAGVQITGGVGQAGDAYERNADAAADAVVAGTSAEALLGGGHAEQPHGEAGHGGPAAPAQGAPAQAPASGAPVQRKEAGKSNAPCPTCGGGGCGECSAKPAASAPAAAPAGKPVVQRLLDDAPVQMEEDPNRPGEPGWTPPEHCPADFCKPFPTRLQAELDKSILWPILRVGIMAKVGVKAAGMWELWAMGGTGVLDLSGVFGADFTNSPTTLSTATYLRDRITAAVAGRAPLAAGRSETVQLADLIGAAEVTATESGMDFNVIADLAGNIAGGIGTDQAANPIGRRPSPQDDARRITGSVLIEGLAGGDQNVTPTLSFRVADTVDLCPGNCGADSEQIATVPMSRWEASGVAGDVPYTVTFPAPASAVAPIAVHPGGGSAPSAPKATPPEGGKSG